METKILDGSQAQIWLRDVVGMETKQVDFCSAYMKVSSLDYFYSAYKAKGFNGRIRLLARWKANDLIAGASDLEVYEYCRDREVDFFIKEDFHGKIYQSLPGGILIGSFNLTDSGFGLKESPNDEAGVQLPNDEKNSIYIDELFLNSHKVDDILFSRLKEFIQENKNANNNNVEWSDEIQSLLAKSSGVSKYLVNEFFYKKYNPNSLLIGDQDLTHDLSLLGVDLKDLDSKEIIESRLRCSVPYVWLKNILKENKGEIYFGALSEKLNNCLVDDPRPYRKDVKNLVQNFLSWISHFCSAEISIDQPNHSQRIRLLT